MGVMLKSLGVLLGRAWIAYGLGALLFPSVLCLHLLVLIVVVDILRCRRQAIVFRRFCEIVYGLINPIAYLAIIGPGLTSYEAPVWRHVPLTAIAWVLLLLVWGVRLFGSGLPSAWRSALVINTIQASALTCLYAFGLKDAQILGDTFTNEPGETVLQRFVWPLAATAPLYAIPALLLMDHIREYRHSGRDSRQSFFLLRESLSRRAALVVMGLGLVTLIASAWHPSQSALRRLVLEHQDEILRAGRTYDVDPRVIASIIYVTNRDQISSFRASAETVALAAWLEDPKSDFYLGAPLNISVGLSQIKPATAQTALMLATHDGDSTTYDKEFREVPHLKWSLAKGTTSHWETPTPPAARKAQIVEALLDDRGNVAFCALILALYQIQWANIPGADIRNRPDILATLFEIGFERSHPHANPRSNAFGRAVQEAYDSPWLREAFR